MTTTLHCVVHGHLLDTVRPFNGAVILYDSLLQVIAENHNVCSQLHMPAQSGHTAMLARMRRGYTRDAYDALVAHVRATIPNVALSTDIITGAAPPPPLPPPRYPAICALP